MNVLKGLYVWTLVSLLILAGCLGGGVIDEGEGQSVPEDNGTTNNYYTGPEIFSAGGVSQINSYTQGMNGSDGEFIPTCFDGFGASQSSVQDWEEILCEFTVHTINTQQGEMLTFIGSNFENLRVNSTCSGIEHNYGIPSGIAIGNGAMACEYTLTHHVNPHYGFSNLWSTAYTITPVTVV